MRIWLLLLASFIGLYESFVALWWRAVSAKQQKTMAGAIRAGLAPPEGIASPVILVEPAPKARGLAGFFKSAARPRKDNSASTKPQLAIVTLAAALAGFLVGTQFVSLIGAAAPLIAAVGFGAVPRMVQKRKERKRLAVLEEQLPEALDCLARSMRAGNAFSVAIELLAAEIAEPLKSEIQKISRELALGAILEDALSDLIARVPLMEVRFFVSAVLLQRDTGGNLSEVIGKLADSLRERFKVRGHVKAASGQGRLTAGVLSVLPVVTVAILTLLSPEYMRNLTDDPVGRDLLAAAVVFQVVGYIVMKRITRIEV
jgi:tight adherence protein B